MRKKLDSRGFSLIEIMIVLVIIGTIIGMVSKRIFGAKDRAADKQMKIIIQQVADQLEMYQQDCNSYPSTSQGLAALTKQPAGEPACESWGPAPYSKEVPRDAWGKPMTYESDGSTFELISNGKDGRPGGDKDYSSKTIL